MCQEDQSLFIGIALELMPPFGTHGSPVFQVDTASDLRSSHIKGRREHDRIPFDQVHIIGDGF